MTADPTPAARNLLIPASLAGVMALLALSPRAQESVVVGQSLLGAAGFVGAWAMLMAATHAGATIQLETRPEDPYSVNIAFTVLGGRLYVNAGDTETQWVKNIAANPRVRLRMDGALYDLLAERVTDTEEIAAFGAAWTSQSFFRRDPARLEEVWIYRLVSR